MWDDVVEEIGKNKWTILSFFYRHTQNISLRNLFRPEAIESHHVLRNRHGQIVDILFVVKWQGYEERSSESIRNVKDYGLLFENYVFDQLVTTSR